VARRISSFECPACHRPVKVWLDDNKIWHVKCAGCRLHTKMRLPQAFRDLDAYGYTLDHVVGRRYRFVEIVSTPEIDTRELQKLKAGLAYLQREVIAELKCSEQHAYDLLWKAYQEGWVERKKIKGKTYWLIRERGDE